ncbi:MAG: hypothetical protein COB36_12275 [Alphaproteobacteria bacterium]|nr:MAG: hypothetical protein COB36_12275 [Alphaproteobacteria bacterium]
MTDPDGWRGDLDGNPTFFEKSLFSEGGYKITLHRMVSADDEDCFHSHPAIAFRCVLAGGYEEEFPDGRKEIREPGYIGLVTPETVHRISRLLVGVSFSLWIRLPKTRDIKLIGNGWPPLPKTPKEGE